METTKEVRKMKIDTPVGSLESDSGNHFIDVISIIGVVAVLYAGKKIIDKCVNNFRL